MPQLLLIRGAKQLLTLRGPRGVRRGAALEDLAIVEDGSILIRDGWIAQVGSTRRVENLKECRGAAEISVNGAVVMPGFVDPAIHLFASQLSSGRKRKSYAEFLDETLILLRCCLQHGTLHAQLKISSCEKDAKSDLALLRQLSSLGENPVGMVRTWRLENRSETAGRTLNEVTAAIPYLAKRKLAQRVEVAPQGGAAFREKIWAAAVSNSLAINLLWAGGSAELLANLLARLKPRSVSSARALTETECALLAGSSVPIIFSSAESLTDSSFAGTVQQLAKGGAPIALASGYDEREMPVLNMQAVISLAVLRLNLTTEQAISAATINAAYAVGRGHLTGSLEVGKRADLVVLNLANYREIPRRFGINHVGMAIRDGKIAFNRTGWKVSAA